MLGLCRQGKHYKEIIRDSFNKEGLSDDEAFSVFLFLKELGRVTGDSWGHGRCESTGRIAENAKELYDQVKINGFYLHFGPPVPKRYDHTHFFITSEPKDIEDTLIIDPTGVPVNEDEIEQYFGLLSKASKDHRDVYEKAEDLDRWGTMCYHIRAGYDNLFID